MIDDWGGWGWENIRCFFHSVMFRCGSETRHILEVAFTVG